VRDYAQVRHEGAITADIALDALTLFEVDDEGLDRVDREILELILRGTTDREVAACLGSTPALCRLGLDILSWQKLKTRLPSQLPLGTKVAHKTGTGSRGFMDADRRATTARCSSLPNTEHVQRFDGTPFTAAYRSRSHGPSLLRHRGALRRGDGRP
jgi:hypothetical protein